MERLQTLVELSSVKGLGPAKQQALRDAGIKDVETLAGLDLRRNVAVDGVTQDGLKALKARARQTLRAEGAPVPKAPYNKASGTQATPRRTPTKKTADEPVATLTEKRPGFLRRLLARN